MHTILCVYLSSAFLAIIITPIVIKLGRRINAVDRPGVRTVHTRPIPRIGGLTIFLSAMFLIIIVLFLNNSIGKAFRNMQLQLISLFCCATFIFLVGLVDDLKGLPAKFKFLAELLAAGLLCIMTVRISSIKITEQWTVQLGLLSYPLTILWIVGITNAVNLSDGLDGLAAGISAIACGVIAVFAIYSNNVIMAIIMLALLGSLSGFLFFNFNPAKIFMGDCGSLFLGFAIASSSVLCSMKSSALVGIALPVLALGIPIFDTLFSMLRRFLDRRRLFAPDRRHFHHILMDMGIKQCHVVITIYVATLLFTGLGMFMMVTRDKNSIVIFACILVLIFLLFNVVGSVRLRETIFGLQRKYELANRSKQEQMKFEDAQLHFRNAHTFSQWWAAACKAAERFDFAWLSLKSEDQDGTIRTEVWCMSDVKPDLSRLVIMIVPLARNGDETSYEFEVAISINGSLESAGHRATLFTRLIDEHDIIALSRNGKATQLSNI